MKKGFTLVPPQEDGAARHKRQPLMLTTLAHAAALTCASVLMAAPVYAAPPAPVEQRAVDQSQPDQAKKAPAADTSAMQEVVVTARRISENVQRVPIAVTAVPETKLQQMDIRDLTSIAKVTPGVALCCTAWNNATLTVVRGIQQGAPTYFADVPVNSNGYANFFDIANVQVLKGPQGTLFGQASVAGAFVYTPRKPGNTFGGTISTVVGSYDRRTIEAAVDVPLVKDRVLVRLAGVSHYRKGYVHDLSNNLDYGDENYSVLRPSMTWKITDKLENYTLFQAQRARTNGQSNGQWVLEDLNFNPGQFTQSAQLQALNGGSLAAFNALKDQMLATQLRLGPYQVLGLSTGCPRGDGVPIPGPATVTSLDYPRLACPADWQKDNLLVNTTTYRFNDDWLIKNTYGRYRSLAFIGPQDLEMTPLNLANTNSPRNTFPFSGVGGGPIPQTDSDELQLQGKAGIFDFTLGAFKIWRKFDKHVIYTTSLVTDVAQRSDNHQESQAVFGQTNIHLDRWLPGLSATLGARYNQDSISQTVYNLNPTTLAVTSVSGGPDSPSGHIEFHNVPYTAGIQYQATPRTMYYLTNARSYNAGGLQNVAGFPSFSPAELNNVELGVKSSFEVGDVKARANFSLFNGKFNDVQVTTFTLITNPANGTVSFGNVTRNAAKAKIQGAEADLTVVPFVGLELGAVAGYLHNRYTKWPSLDPLTLQPIDLSNTSFTRSPTWKVDLHGTYTLPLSQDIGELKLTANWAWQSLMIHSLTPRTPTNPAQPNTGLMCNRQRTAANGYGPLSADGGTAWLDCKPAYANLDLNLTWRGVMGNSALTMIFGVTNFNKNVWSGSQANLDRSAGFTAFQPAVPRMWTFRTTYDF
jgi:iron complex outermembrane receptor protein